MGWIVPVRQGMLTATTGALALTASCEMGLPTKPSDSAELAVVVSVARASKVTLALDASVIDEIDVRVNDSTITLPVTARDIRLPSWTVPVGQVAVRAQVWSNNRSPLFSGDTTFTIQEGATVTLDLQPDGPVLVVDRVHVMVGTGRPDSVLIRNDGSGTLRWLPGEPNPPRDSCDDEFVPCFAVLWDGDGTVGEGRSRWLPIRAGIARSRSFGLPIVSDVGVVEVVVDAQSPGLASVVGQVIADSVGIRGATVLLSTGQTTASDANGVFSFGSLPLGPYRVSVFTGPGLSVGSNILLWYDGQVARPRVEL